MSEFEPIGGPGGAIVDDTSPDQDPGRVWFDTSPSDGVDVKLATDSGWTLIGMIPDDQVASFDYSDAGFGQLDHFEPLGELSQEAFVGSSSPEHVSGRIWFDPSPSGGVDVHVADDTGWTLVGQIPYLTEIAPSAEFSSSPTEPTVGDPVSFSAGTYENVASYTIDYDDTSNRQLTDRTDISSIPSNTYSSYGPHYVTLTVENEDGMTRSYTTTVDIQQEVPSVSISADSTTVTEGETVSVSLSATHDDSYTVEWGDGSTDTGGSVPSSLSHSYSSDGTYSPTLTVENVTGQSASDSTADITVNNPTPTASISADSTTVTEGETVSVTISGDPAYSYTIDWGDGSTYDGSIDSGGSSDPSLDTILSHSYSSDGTYSPTLTVNNGTGQSASDSTADITVNDPTPTASISADSTTVTEGETVSVSLSATHDDSYAVEWGDGTTDTGGSVPSSLSHSYSSDGTYSPTLTVNNGTGQSASDSTADITVNDPTPTASISTDSTTVTEGETVSVSLSATHDDSYAVEWGDGSTDTGGSVPSSLSHSYASDGSYSPKLIVNNGTGQSVSDSTADITVNDPTPTASISADSTTVTEGETVSVSLSATHDDSYTVEWGDGSTDTGGSVPSSLSHSYSSDGSYSPKLTVNNGTGQSASDSTADITVNDPTPTASISADSTTVTEGETVSVSLSATHDDSYTVEWGDGSTDTGGSVPSSLSHSYSSDGSYSPKLTVNNGTGQSVSDSTADITVNDPTPTASISADSTTVTEGETVSVSLSATHDDSYTVEWGDGSTDTGGSVPSSLSHSYSSDGSYSPKLTVNNGTGQSVSDSTADITVNDPTPTASISADSTIVTEDETVSVSLSATHDDSYTVDWGDGTTDTGDSVPSSLSHSYSSDGTYSPTLTVNNGTGQSVSDSTADITVIDPIPTASISADSTTVTEDETVSVSLSATHDDSYTVDWGDGTTDTGDSVPSSLSHSYSSDGTYSPTLTVNNGTGQSVSDSTADITIIDPIPTASISADSTTVTEGETVSVSLSATRDDSYTVDWGDGSTDTGGSVPSSLSHSYSSDGTYSPTLTVNNGTGQSASDSTADITVTDPTPTASISADSTTVTERETVYVTISGDHVDSYTVDWGDGSTYSRGSSDPSLSATLSHIYYPGTYAPTLTVNNGMGQSASDSTADITVIEPIPTASISADSTTVTEGDSVSVSLSATHDDSYTVEWGDGSTDTGGSVPSSLSHSYSSDGTYSPTLTVENATGQSDSDSTADITVNHPEPEASILVMGYGNSFNKGETVDFIISGDHADSYTIDWGDGSTDSGGSSDPSLYSILSHSYSSSGTYSPTLTVNNGTGQSASDSTENVIINSPSPTASISADSTSVTEGEAVSVSLSASRSDLYTVFWGDGSTDRGSSVPSSLSHTYSSDGTYSPTLAVNNGTGQSASDSTADITVTDPTPTASIDANSLYVDTGETVSVSLSATHDDSYTVEWGDGSTDSSNSIPSSLYHSYSSPGTYSPTLTVNNGTGQSATDTTTDIIVNEPEPEPTASISAGTLIIDEGETVTFSLSATHDDSYTVDWGDGTTDTGGSVPSSLSHSYSSDGTYAPTLTVNNGAGQSASDSTPLITVNEPEPTASISADSNFVSLGDPADFELSATHDDSYTVEWGDGTQDTGNSVPSSLSHTYSIADTHRPTLTVNNGAGESASDQALVTVPDANPSVSIVPSDGYYALPGDDDMYDPLQVKVESQNCERVELRWGTERQSTEVYDSPSGHEKYYVNPNEVDTMTTYNIKIVGWGPGGTKVSDSVKIEWQGMPYYDNGSPYND